LARFDVRRCLIEITFPSKKKRIKRVKILDLSLTKTFVFQKNYITVLELNKVEGITL